MNSVAFHNVKKVSMHVIFGGLLTTIGFIGCCPSVTPTVPLDSPEVSIFDDDVYKNKALGFQISIPSNWKTVDENLVKKLTPKAKELAKGADVNEAEFDAGREHTVNLLRVTKFGLDSPHPENASLSILADRRVTNAHQYLCDVSEAMDAFAEITSPAHPILLGEREWQSAHLEIDTPAGPSHLWTVATEIENHILVIMFSYRSKDELPRLIEIAESAQIDR